ncbi:hypothetical protein E4U28_005393, partial [Claviceps purpurea]
FVKKYGEGDDVGEAGTGGYTGSTGKKRKGAALPLTQNVEIESSEIQNVELESSEYTEDDADEPGEGGLMVMSPGSATFAGNGKWIWLRQLSLSLDRVLRGQGRLRGQTLRDHDRSLSPSDIPSLCGSSQPKAGGSKARIPPKTKPSEKRPSDKYDCWKVEACKESSQPKSGGSKARISPQLFFPDNSIHFPADHITREATESSYFDADDHDNTSRPSMPMAYGICTLENQFNSYYSTAILQSGGYPTKTAISTSKTNSIATF